MGFKNTAPKYGSTEAAMRAVNEALCGQLHDANYVAMFYAVLDPTTRLLTYTQAGTPPALLVRSHTAEVIPLHTRGTVIGILADVHLEEQQIQLEPGDKVLFYSDAIVETTDPAGEMLGVAGLRAFMAERGHLPLNTLLDEIYAFGQEYSGQATYDDDFTLVGLQIAG
jgi:sigma-B regulation protein RsbU (phosphoserine phosphatase)